MYYSILKLFNSALYQKSAIISFEGVILKHFDELLEVFLHNSLDIIVLLQL